MSDTCTILLFLQASPWPDVIWLKDGIPVSKRVTISNAEGGSQILIPSAERSDTGIYTIVVKNIVGQETFSIEIRVTGKMREPVCLSDTILIHLHIVCDFCATSVASPNRTLKIFDDHLNGPSLSLVEKQPCSQFTPLVKPCC